MTKLFQKYVTFTDERHAFICSLWCAQTWLFRAQSLHGIETVGYLAFASPVENCGKTAALTVTSALSYGHPSIDVMPTPATIFRAIGETRATVILDELDGLDEESEIVSILNAGYKKGAKVKRMVGKERDKVQEFETFCPKAVAYIRDSKSLRAIKRTLESRCIRILLKRRTKAEQKAAPKLRARRLAKETAPLVGDLVTWAFSVGELTEIFPLVEMEELNGREQEVWENLFAVAYLAGRLPEARAAALELAVINREEIEDHSGDTPLLRDILQNLDVMCDEDGFSTELAAEWLRSMADRPYAKWTDGYGIKGGQLAKILSKYGLRAKHVGKRRLRRINRGLVLDMLERHLPQRSKDDDHDQAA